MQTQQAIIATGVSVDDYLGYYAEHYCEYTAGTVTKIGVSWDVYYCLVRYLRTALHTRFARVQAAYSNVVAKSAAEHHSDCGVSQIDGGRVNDAPIYAKITGDARPDDEEL